MDTLGEKHIQFLQYCADRPWRKHASDLPVSELQQMVDEGLLIKYTSGTEPMYSVTRAGSQVAISYGESPVKENEAIAFIISKGYSLEEAQQIVKDHGTTSILKSKAEIQQSEAQREVKVPLNAQGKPEIKFKG